MLFWSGLFKYWIVLYVHPLINHYSANNFYLVAGDSVNLPFEQLEAKNVRNLNQGFVMRFINKAFASYKMMSL